MAVNRTQNLNLKIATKTVDSNITVTGVAVSQKIKLANPKKIAFSNITNVDGYVTKSYTSTISTSVADAGTVDEITTTTISSVMPYNDEVTIATVAIAADSGFNTIGKPSIKITPLSGISLSLKETSVANTYNLNCKITGKRIIQSTADMSYQVVKTYTRTDAINSIAFGSSTIPTMGATKKIKIHGSPKTPFNLFVLDENDESIVASTSTSVTPVGVKTCISGSLDKKGYYNVRQRFPGLKKICTTTINVGGGVTNATQVTFASLSGVAVGDQVFILDSRGGLLNNGRVVKVASIDSTYVCTLTSPITAANSTAVIFKRSSNYKIHLTAGDNVLKSTINQYWPTFTLNQYLDPILKVTASCTAPRIINSASAGVSDIQTFSGKPNEIARRINKNSTLTLKYVLEGRTYTAKANRPNASDFVVASGDTNFSVYNIVTSGSGTSTFTIYADLVVEKWGILDTLVTLNIDDITS